MNHHLPEEQELINSNPNQYYDKERKCLKYHYTNLKALKKILGAKNIWLMHCKHLKDTTEGNLVFNHLIEQSKKTDFIEALKALHQTIIKKFYVGSFSLYGNSLSQWRGYGNVCIGFDFTKLQYDLRFIEDLKGSRLVSSGINFTRCDYIDPSIKDDINSFTKNITQNFKGLSNNSLEDIPQFQYHALTLGTLLFGVKHIDFQEEHEYRIFYYLYNVVPFKNKDGDPYIKFLFNPEHIKRIVIGPSNQQDEIYKDILNFLEQNNLEYKHVELYRSKIPYYLLKSINTIN